MTARTHLNMCRPIPRMGNYSVAGGALRHWLLNLHEALAGTGVYVAHVPIAGLIGPELDPDTIAQLSWELYTKRDEAEHPYGLLDKYSSGKLSSAKVLTVARVLDVLRRTAYRDDRSRARAAVTACEVSITGQVDTGWDIRPK